MEPTIGNCFCWQIIKRKGFNVFCRSKLIREMERTRGQLHWRYSSRLRVGSPARFWRRLTGCTKCAIWNTWDNTIWRIVGFWVTKSIWGATRTKTSNRRPRSWSRTEPRASTLTLSKSMELKFLTSNSKWTMAQSVIWLGSPGPLPSDIFAIRTTISTFLKSSKRQPATTKSSFSRPSSVSIQVSIRRRLPTRIFIASNSESIFFSRFLLNKLFIVWHRNGNENVHTLTVKTIMILSQSVSYSNPGPSWPLDTTPKSSTNPSLDDNPRFELFRENHRMDSS